MDTKLLSRTDVRRLVEGRAAHGDSFSMMLCTVLEPIQLADHVQKGTENLTWPEFFAGFMALMETGNLYVAPLDMDCLNRALFDRSDTSNVIGLWNEVCSADITPVHTAHRLILRPSAENFWADDLYAEMEAWHVGEGRGV